MNHCLLARGVILAVAAAAALSAQGQDQARGPRSVTGRITAINANNLTLDVRDRTGTSSTLKVSTEAATTVWEAKAGALSDLKPNHLVLIGTYVGTTGKLTVRRIAQLPEVTGTPKSEDLSASRALAAGVLGAVAQPSQPQPPPQQQPSPQRQPSSGGRSLGKILKVSPLTIERYAPDGQSSTVEVATTSATTVVLITPLALKDLKVGDTVTARAAGPLQEGQTEIKAAAVTRVPTRR